jgi:hypothetical protein
MAYFLITLGLVGFAMFASIKTLLVMVTGCFLIASVVKIAAANFSGTTVTYGDALKAVAASTALLAFTGFLIGGITHSGPGTNWGGPILLFIPLAFISYTLGFHCCLPTNFKSSAIVASVSTVAAAVIVLALKHIA